MPSASGLPGHEEPARATAAGACADAAGGAAAVGTCADAGAVAAATAGEPWATPVGAFDVTSELGAGLSPVVSTNGALCSSTVVTTDRTGPSADAVCSGDVEPIGTEDLCERITPNPATHTTIASAHTIAARRMAKSPTLRALNAMGRREPRLGPPTLFISSYPMIADRFHQTFHYYDRLLQPMVADRRGGYGCSTETRASGNTFSTPRPS